MNATERAINCVIQQWHLAEARHELNGTTPDQPAAEPMDKDDKDMEMLLALQELYRVACTCGC